MREDLAVIRTLFDIGEIACQLGIDCPIPLACADQVPFWQTPLAIKDLVGLDSLRKYSGGR